MSTAIQTLLHDNVTLLEQGLELLEGMDEELYRSPRPEVSLSGAGSHVRHSIDFYERFLEALRSDGERLDYDGRQRDERLEKDPTAAGEKIRSIIAELERRVPAAAGRPLLVKSDARIDDPADAPWGGSSIERELQVLSSHTVHHYALIAVVLRLHGHAVDDEFGVAPSTLRYWKEQRACAR